MKIKISKAQWEGIGKKAGWVHPPELSRIPSSGEITGNSTSDNAVFEEESIIRKQQAKIAVQNLLKNIEPTVIMLAKRSLLQFEDVKQEDLEDTKALFLYEIVQIIEEMIEGKV